MTSRPDLMPHISTRPLRMARRAFRPRSQKVHARRHSGNSDWNGMACGNSSQRAKNKTAPFSAAPASLRASRREGRCYWWAGLAGFVGAQKAFSEFRPARDIRGRILRKHGCPAAGNICLPCPSLKPCKPRAARQQSSWAAGQPGGQAVSPGGNPATSGPARRPATSNQYSRCAPGLWE